MTLLQKIGRKSQRTVKQLRRLLFVPSGQYECFAMLLGCQKSGMSTLLNMLEYDHRAEIFREDSALTEVGARRLRLRPIPEVARVLQQIKVPLIVAEPKVESHRAKELLDSLPRSRVLWLARDFRSWIDANLQRRSGQNLYLKVLLEQAEDWRAEGASEETRALVQKFYAPELSRTNCAAIIWYCRNVLFFEQQLHLDERVAVVRYESLVRETEHALQQVYRFLSMEPVTNKASKIVRGRVIAEPNAIDLDPEIEHACMALQEKLLQRFERQGCPTLQIRC